MGISKGLWGVMFCSFLAHFENGKFRILKNILGGSEKIRIESVFQNFIFTKNGYLLGWAYS